MAATRRSTGRPACTACRIDGKYYEGYTGPAFFSAQEFVSPTNPNNACYPPEGAWPYGNCGNYYRDGGVPGPDGGVPGTRSPYTLLTKSYAAFGQVEYRATDLIGLTLGARVTRDQKDYHFSWYPYESFPSDPNNAVTLLTPPGRQHADRLSQQPVRHPGQRQGAG